MDKIFDLIEKEKNRQNGGLELIASENYVSSDILNAVGSILTNKYAEGYRTTGNLQSLPAFWIKICQCSAT